MHSITMSQKRMGHRPMLIDFMNPAFTTMESKKHARVNNIWITTLVVRNLTACLTVPSLLSYPMAVGT